MDPDLHKHIKFVKVRAQSCSCKILPVGTGVDAAVAASFMDGMCMVSIAAAQLFGGAGVLHRLPHFCDSCTCVGVCYSHTCMPTSLTTILSNTCCVSTTDLCSTMLQQCLQEQHALRCMSHCGHHRSPDSAALHVLM
jgi:hypothetical protein